MVVAERQYGEDCAMRGRVQTLQEGSEVSQRGDGFAEGADGGGDVYN